MTDIPAKYNIFVGIFVFISKLSDIGQAIQLAEMTAVKNKGLRMAQCKKTPTRWTNDILRVAGSLWHTVGEAYVQQWTVET